MIRNQSTLRMLNLLKSRQHKLKMEIGAVNILVDRYTDLELLAKVIKVVNEINV